MTTLTNDAEAKTHTRGAVASVFALYGKQRGRRDLALWWRFCPFTLWPPEALAEAARLASIWMGYIPLPGYAA